MDLLLFVLWFFWPAGSANSAPVLANNISWLRPYTFPLDFGKSFRGRRIFGDHKTFRGLIAGVINGAIIGLVQFLLATQISWFANLSDTINYTQPNVILLGALLGFGALSADALKSFFKRQIGVPSGKSWFPFDQTDYVIGGVLVALPFVPLTGLEIVMLFVVWFLIHPIANIIGWLLRLKPNPF